MSESENVNTASCSEPEASSSKVITKSEHENQKTKVENNSKSKAPELQFLKRSEPNKQVLRKTESESQKSRFQRQKAVNAKSQSKTVDGVGLSFLNLKMIHMMCFTTSAFKSNLKRKIGRASCRERV